MNASELADMFSRMRERYADAEPDSYNAKFIEHDIGDMALRELEVIVKSLRFAADMERLLDCKDREIVFRKLSGGRIQVSSSWRENAELRVFDEVFSCVDDIYAAARNAVEKLEGKSP